MPELPEVELARRALERWFDGRRLVATHAEKSRVFRGTELEEFEALRGPLTHADRKGKYLLLRFGKHGLMAHLGMTGKFVKRSAKAVESHSRARFVLDDGNVIHFKDPRMFGRFELADAAALPKLDAVAALGFDPLNEKLTPQILKAELQKSKQDLKVALMDQSRVCGLGNIHAAEALFRAGLHPGREPGSLTDPEWKALTQGINAALAFALEAEAGGDEIQYVEEKGAPNPFLIYGRAGEPCKKCKTTVLDFVQGGRTTHFCPHCQPAKKAKKK